MPQYDFRCDACQLRFSVYYRSYREYDAAAVQCPECESAELSRLITAVALRRASRDYRKMSSGEMLSVLESGDERQTTEMFKQVRGDGAAQSDSTLGQPAEPKGGQPASDTD